MAQTAGFSKEKLLLDIDNVGRTVGNMHDICCIPLIVISKLFPGMHPFSEFNFLVSTVRFILIARTVVAPHFSDCYFRQLFKIEIT